MNPKGEVFFVKIETEVILPFRLPIPDGHQIVSEYYF